MNAHAFERKTPPAVCVQGPDLRLRRMRPEDTPGIMAIESVSFGGHHWVEDSFLNEMNSAMGRYYSLFHPAAEGGERLIGYGGYWQILDEVHITTVAVDPAYRGNALGELMLVLMLDRGYGSSTRWTTLEVRASNHAAQNLYYKYGFRLMGTRPKYYQDNQEDALIMTTPDMTSEDYRTLYRNNREALTARLGGLPEGF